MSEAEAGKPYGAHALVLERARRLAPQPPPGNAIGDLAAGLSPGEVSERRGLTVATARGIRSFYDQLDPVARVCEGTACRFSGGDLVRERLEGLGPVGSVRCLGHCYAAPAFRSGDKIYSCPESESVAGWLDEWGEGPSPMVDLHPIPRTRLAPEPVVLRHLAAGSRFDPWVEYDLPEGDTILRHVAAARLPGRRGEASPSAALWRTARDTPSDVRYVVANGDEGDPGSYVDRLLLEETPHAVLAGMVACARAIGATRGVLYVRAEYPQALRSARAAVAEARGRGAFGAGLEIDVVAGAGAYVCGEDGALLRSIEGLRGEPGPEPPGPAERGLFGRPTVVESVETMATIPWAVRHASPPGTRVVCLGGAVRRRGLVEAPVGMPLREVLERAGGGPPAGRRWGMALVGGPLGRVLPESRFDTPLSHDALPPAGHAGVVVLDDEVTPRRLAEHLFAFARSESCGACAPCRAGTARIAGLRRREALERLLLTMRMGSLCGFGAGVTRPILDLLEHYGEAVLR